MALDKLVDSTQLNSDLTSIASAIRTKGGTSAQLLFPSGFVSAVQAIPTGTQPTGTKTISISANGTTTEDVTDYASAQITVAVPQPSGTKSISIAANGTTTEDVTSYASAEITVNVPSAPAGLTLLGSGTYTKASDGASISIPVTYTGTPKLFYAVNTTPKADTAQTVLFGRWIAFADADAESVEPVGGLWMAKGVNSSGTVTTTAAASVIPQLSSTTMSSSRPGSGYTHCAGTWHWYIYGEAST